MNHQTKAPADALWLGAGVAEEVGRHIVEDLDRIGCGATVKSVRFLPSTSVKRQDGDVEVIANTTIIPTQGGPRYPQTFESVVTLNKSARRHHWVKNVWTHALDRMTPLAG